MFLVKGWSLGPTYKKLSIGGAMVQKFARVNYPQVPTVTAPVPKGPSVYKMQYTELLCSIVTMVKTANST